MNLLDNIIIGQPDPLTLRQVLNVVIAVVAPLVAANPNLSASPDDVALALDVLALAPNEQITPSQIAGTARVVALGTDWLRANDMAEIERDWPGVALLMSYVPSEQVEQYVINILSKGSTR